MLVLKSAVELAMHIKLQVAQLSLSTAQQPFD